MITVSSSVYGLLGTQKRMTFTKHNSMWLCRSLGAAVLGSFKSLSMQCFVLFICYAASRAQQINTAGENLGGAHF